MARRALTVCAVLLATGCGGSAKPAVLPPPSGLTPQRARALDAALRHELEVSAVPGISAAVVFPDGKEWTGAVGDAVLEPEQAMTPSTTLVFDSVTKIATAALTLRLVEQGKLRLDDPIRRWYPAWRGDPRATVRDLLGHTSGAAREPPERFYRSLLRHPKRDVTPQEYIAATPKPGPRTTEVKYSNAGFLIVGAILERVTGEPLAKAMRRELFQHPGGDGLALEPDEQPHSPRVHAYWYPNGGAEPRDASDGGPILPFRSWAHSSEAAAGLAGDVPSLARWAHELLGGRILKAGSLREMTRFHSAGLGVGYGLGLVSDSAAGTQLWGHDGDGLGSHTELWHAPRERVTVAVSWNDDAFDTDPAFLRALLHAALG